MVLIALSLSRQVQLRYFTGLKNRLPRFCFFCHYFCNLSLLRCDAENDHYSAEFCPSLIFSWNAILFLWFLGCNCTHTRPYSSEDECVGFESVLEVKWTNQRMDGPMNGHHSPRMHSCGFFDVFLFEAGFSPSQ